MSARSKSNGRASALPTTGSVIGYARCSTTSQDLTPQIEQLRAAGCTRITLRRFPAREPTGRSG